MSFVYLGPIGLGNGPHVIGNGPHVFLGFTEFLSIIKQFWPTTERSVAQKPIVNLCVFLWCNYLIDYLINLLYFQTAVKISL